jgi:hypothetical protein
MRRSSGGWPRRFEKKLLSCIRERAAAPSGTHSRTVELRDGVGNRIEQISVT